MSTLSTVVPYQQPSFPDPTVEWWATSGTVTRNASNIVSSWAPWRGSGVSWTPQGGSCEFKSIVNANNRPYPGIFTPAYAFLQSNQNVTNNQTWVMAYSRTQTTTGDGQGTLFTNRTGAHLDQPGSAYIAMYVNNMMTMQPNYGSNLQNHQNAWTQPSTTDLCISGWAIPSIDAQFPNRRSCRMVASTITRRAVEHDSSLGSRIMTGNAPEIFNDDALWTTVLDTGDSRWRNDLNIWGNNRLAIGGHNSAQVTEPTLGNQNRPLNIHSIFRWDSALTTRQLIDFGIYLKGRYENADVPI